MTLTFQASQRYLLLDQRSVDPIELDGLAKGREKGGLIALRSTLVRLRGWRFGDVAGAAGARVEQASLDEIQRWFDRVLDAPTVNDVFAEP